MPDCFTIVFPVIFSYHSTPFGNKKSLFPLWGTGTEKTFLRYHPACRECGRLTTVPTHRLPVNAGNASEDTLGNPISPCPRRPICCPAFRSALSCAELSVDALCSFTPASMVCYQVMPVIHHPCAFVKHYFYTTDGQVCVHSAFSQSQSLPPGGRWLAEGETDEGWRAIPSLEQV